MTKKKKNNITDSEMQLDMVLYPWVNNNKKCKKWCEHHNADDECCGGDCRCFDWEG